MIQTSKQEEHASPGNVISFPGQRDGDRESRLGSSVLEDSLLGRRTSPKEDVEEGRNNILEDHNHVYRWKNYRKEYKCWDNMIQRCRTGKGVLDPRFVKFHDFMMFMGPMPGPGYSIDRKDFTNPEYSPDNCRWASKTTQTRNRCTTRMLTDKSGRCLPVAEWAEEVGLAGKTILRRIGLGWSEHEAIHCPKWHRREKSGLPVLPQASMDEIVTLYVKKLMEHHGQGFVPILAKDKKMLKEIARHLEVGGLPSLPALAGVLDNWSGFTVYADKVYGKFNPPRVPTPEYLYRALPAIGNYYLRHVEEEQQEAARDKETHRKQERADRPEEPRSFSIADVLENLERDQDQEANDSSE